MRAADRATVGPISSRPRLAERFYAQPWPNCERWSPGTGSGQQCVILHQISQMRGVDLVLQRLWMNLTAFLSSYRSRKAARRKGCLHRFDNKQHFNAAELP